MHHFVSKHAGFFCFVSFVVVLAASGEIYRAQNGGKILQNDFVLGFI